MIFSSSHNDIKQKCHIRIIEIKFYINSFLWLMNGFVMAYTLTFKCNGLCDVFRFDILLLIDNEHIPIFLEFPAIFVNPLLDLILYKHQNHTSSNIGLQSISRLTLYSTLSTFQKKRSITFLASKFCNMILYNVSV